MWKRCVIAVVDGDGWERIRRNGKGKFGCWEFDGGGVGLNEKMKEKPSWKSAMGETRGWHDNPSTYMTKNVNWW